MMLDLLEPGIKDLLFEIESLGFRFCLVGGAVRDLCLHQALGRDLDFEVRAEQALNPEQWAAAYEKLPAFLQEKQLPFKRHPYLITTLKFKGHELEFSSPRLETPIPGNLSHHHFSAQMDTRLSYQQSFFRRDLTINAIGIEFNVHEQQERLVDPYGGMKDLENKLLRHLNDYFFEDSVRFLRLIRFSLTKQGFVIDQHTLSNLSHFKLQGLSIYHFKKELEKSGDCSGFLKRMRELIFKAGLSLRSDLQDIVQRNWPAGLHGPEDMAGHLLIKNEQEALPFARLFSISEKRIKDMRSFLNSCELLFPIEEIELQSYLEKGLTNTQTKAIVKAIKNLHDKKDCSFLMAQLEAPAFAWQEFIQKPTPRSSMEDMAGLPPEQRSLMVFMLKLKRELQR